MDFFVWNKQDTVMGLTASVLLSSRLDFVHDDVIVIHKKGDKRNVVMMETASSLRETYDIQSEDVNVIGFIVSVILAQEDAQTVREMLKEIDDENKAKSEIKEEEQDFVLEYTKLLEDLLRMDVEKEMQKEGSFIPLKGDYLDPECNVIDLSDVNENITQKKLTVVLKHAFVSEVSDITTLRCMSSFNEQLKELEERREKYAHEFDYESVELVTRQIEALEADILDSCDATMKIEATKVYQYNNAVFVDCANGQTIIMDRDVVESLRTSALEYEKRDSQDGVPYKVHFKTVDIVLNECYNEIKERGNTLFVITV